MILFYNHTIWPLSYYLSISNKRVLITQILILAGRFDEDGSFIGQYGTLQRQQRLQQQQQQQQQQRPRPNGMPPHHAYFPSKSAAGGTYV